jgi:hypothetical protein
MEKIKEDIHQSTKSDNELIISARIGISDYEFESKKLIKEEDHFSIFEIKSKIDGKIYIAKKLQYNVGFKN